MHRRLFILGGVALSTAGCASRPHGLDLAEPTDPAGPYEGETLGLRRAVQASVVIAAPPASADAARNVKGGADIDYLMRPAARRNESSKYTLTVAVTGKALPPLSAARDAKVVGTAYHATAKVPCVLPYQPDVQSCDAGVVRRCKDGAATFEAIGPMGVQHRILFVQGKPVAADTMTPVMVTRQGDVTVVKVSDNQRYDLPDAFLNGG